MRNTVFFQNLRSCSLLTFLHIKVIFGSQIKTKFFVILAFCVADMYVSLKIMVGNHIMEEVIGLSEAENTSYGKVGFVVWHLSVDLLYRIRSGAQSTIN